MEKRRIILLDAPLSSQHNFLQNTIVPDIQSVFSHMLLKNLSRSIVL